jgi:hypothetical protein
MKALILLLAASLAAPAMAQTEETPTPEPTYTSDMTATATPETTSRAPQENMRGFIAPGSFYIEPAVFGLRQDSHINVGSDNEVEGDGMGLAMKLGSQISDRYFAAADIRYQRTQFNEKGLKDVDSDTWNIAPVLGLQTNWYGLRAWGSYILDGTSNPDSAANGLDLRFEKPFGWRAGVGVRISNISLNLEYEDLTYRQTVVQSVGSLGPSAGQNVDFDSRTVAMSVSFPIQL